MDLAVLPEDGAAVREDRDLLAVLVDEAARVLVVLPEVRDVAHVERREHAEDHNEDEDAEESQRHVVAAESAGRERPRALALDP